MKMPRSLRLVFALAVIGFGTVCRGQTDLPEASAGLDAATLQEFDRLDRNRSGGIDEREFGFSTVINRLYEAGKNHLVPRVFTQINTDGNKEIGLLELAKSQLNRNTRLLDNRQNKPFILSDIDLDGFIEIDEYRQRPDAEDAIFNKIDLNESGKIGPFEWLRAIDKKDDSLDAEQAQFFARLDRDDNGALTLEELKKLGDDNPLPSRFEAFDLNGNRELGPSEYSKALANPEPNQPDSDPVAESFRRLDRNRDNTLSLRELQRSPFLQKGKGKGRLASRIALVFGDFDADGDNELSLAEYRKMRARIRIHR